MLGIKSIDFFYQTRKSAYGMLFVRIHSTHNPIVLLRYFIS